MCAELDGGVLEAHALREPDEQKKGTANTCLPSGFALSGEADHRTNKRQRVSGFDANACDVIALRSPSVARGRLLPREPDAGTK
jgi:hypothetical protein